MGKSVCIVDNQEKLTQRLTTTVLMNDSVCWEYFQNYLYCVRNYIAVFQFLFPVPGSVR